MKIISRILITALALVLVSRLIPGVEVEGLYAAVIAALVLGVLNVFVRPILFILTLPITILTLGLFIFVLNAAVFFFAASFIEGFAVDSFVSALLGSAIVSFVSAIGNRFIS